MGGVKAASHLTLGQEMMLDSPVGPMRSQGSCKRQGQSDVMGERLAGPRWLWKTEEPPAQERERPPEAGKGKARVSPLELPEGNTALLTS